MTTHWNTDNTEDTMDDRSDAALRALRFARTTGATDEETVRLILNTADEVGHLRIFAAAMAEGGSAPTLDVLVSDLEPLISVALGEQPHTDETMPDFGAEIIDAWEGAAAEVAAKLRERLISTR